MGIVTTSSEMASQHPPEVVYDFVTNPANWTKSYPGSNYVGNLDELSKDPLFVEKVPQPWQDTDAPEQYISGQLAGIVGIEVAVQRIEGKAKLSQNRSAADRRGVVDGLALKQSAAAHAVAEAMVADL